MIRIRIGISELSAGWMTLLQRIGVEFEEIDFRKNLESNYSSIIVNSKLDRPELDKVDQFTRNNSGGILLISELTNIALAGKSTLNPGYSLPQKYASKVGFFALETGMISQFSFDPAEEISDNRFRRKRFLFKTNHHPDEIVSSVDKKAVLDCVDSVLRGLHSHRQLPYITKWHSPSKKPVFGFRVDSDYGDKESITSLYTIGRKHSIPMTWFLHVQAHEDWLDYFQAFENQEIALHGYEHGTSSSYEHIANNIERGKQLMIDAGLSPVGFSAPYGIWNDVLAEVLLKFNFTYTSEFTLGYDTYPFYPVRNAELHPTLQIPVHPICTGSLNRKKVSEKGMEIYFMEILNQKIGNNENVFFYHHPLQPGLKIWEPVFERVNHENLAKVTFSEFAAFWNQRLDAVVNTVFDPRERKLTCESSLPSQWLRISMDCSKYHLLEASKTDKPLDSFETFLIPPFKEFSVQTIKELKGNRFQLLKTSILDWRNRKGL